MFDNLFGDFEFDETSLYALGLAVLAGLFAFWNMNRLDTLSSFWALAAGIFTTIISFVLITFMWSK